MAIPFTKLEALGNDFVLVDSLKTSHPITPELAARMLDRRRGIGGDQLLWLKPESNCDAHMVIYNPDGSEAEMCGNGIRAAALYLHGLAPKPSYAIATLGGLKKIQMLDPQKGVSRVDMGAPGVAAQAERLSVLGAEIEFYAIDMGNPHAVIFVPQLPSDEEAARVGAAIERHPRFPGRTNVEWVQIVGSASIRVRVWERGAGLTLACGTGACASAVASVASARAPGRIEVRLPGGNLWIEWPGQGAVTMEGPARRVFAAEFVNE